MDAFVGKWKNGKNENAMAYFKAHGLSDELSKTYMDPSLNYTLEYIKEGDGLTLKLDFIKPDNYPSKSYHMVPGVPIETEGMSGEKINYTIRFEGGKMLEDHENPATKTTWSGFKVIDGDDMVAESTMNGVTMKQWFTKA